MNFQSNHAAFLALACAGITSRRLLLVLAIAGISACGSEVEQPIADAAVGHLGNQDSMVAEQVPQDMQALEVRAIKLKPESEAFVLTTLVGKDSSIHHLGFERLILRRPVPDSTEQNDSVAAPEYSGLFEFGRELEFRDISGDGQDEIIIHTSAGGNDVVTSDGLCVLEEADGQIREAFRFDSGAPKLVSLPADFGMPTDTTQAAADAAEAANETVANETADAETADIYAILLHQEFWPLELSHAEAVTFVDSLVFPGEPAADKVARIHQAWFEQQSRLSLDKYKTALESRSSDDVANNNRADDNRAYDIYEAAVHFLMYSKRLPDSDLRPWFEIESGNWQAFLPEDYINALKNLMYPANEAGEQL